MTDITVLTDNYISELLPNRFSNSNKGDYGKAFIVSGSKGMTGSGCLCGKAALRSGAGLVYLGVPNSMISVYSIYVPETIQIPLDDSTDGILLPEASDIILSYLDKMDVLAIGPGLSQHVDIKTMVFNTILKCKKPMVIDADALNVISADVSIFKQLKAPAIITPHPGEMSRLTGLSIEEIQASRQEVASSFSEKWGVITVLKGHNTIIACPSGEVFINSTGNPGMSTAGSGDVLTGIISSFVGQGLQPLNAAIAGVYIHGLAGDIASLAKGFHGLIASDIIECLPEAILKTLA